MFKKKKKENEREKKIRKTLGYVTTFTTIIKNYYFKSM